MKGKLRWGDKKWEKWARVGQTQMLVVLQAALRTNPGLTDFKGEGGEAELL